MTPVSAQQVHNFPVYGKVTRNVQGGQKHFDMRTVCTGWTETTWHENCVYRVDRNTLTWEQCVQGGQKQLDVRTVCTGWTETTWHENCVYRVDRNNLTETTWHENCVYRVVRNDVTKTSQAATSVSNKTDNKASLSVDKHLNTPTTMAAAAAAASAQRDDQVSLLYCTRLLTVIDYWRRLFSYWHVYQGWASFISPRW